MPPKAASTPSPPQLLSPGKHALFWVLLPLVVTLLIFGSAGLIVLLDDEGQGRLVSAFLTCISWHMGRAHGTWSCVCGMRAEPGTLLRHHMHNCGIQAHQQAPAATHPCACEPRQQCVHAVQMAREHSNTCNKPHWPAGGNRVWPDVQEDHCYKPLLLCRVLQWRYVVRISCTGLQV